MINKTKIRAIFKIFAQNNPRPTTELNYNSNFELLIAVILSAQATDVRVNIVTEQLFKVANTPDKILKLGLAGLKDHIKSIGLYNTKAENIIKTCHILMQQHNSQVPTTRQELEALPGVGRKTANVILNTAFRQAEIAVDTHIFRVARRLGLAVSNNVLGVEQELQKNIPQEFKQDAHHWLILHGRYICTAKKPKCHECPIQQYCPYLQKTC